MNNYKHTKVKKNNDYILRISCVHVSQTLIASDFRFQCLRK